MEPDLLFVLFYKPPCGKWYVHSHKTFTSRDAAKEAARKFLPPRTEISLVPFTMKLIEFHEGLVRND